ncbi:hypothetical protein [Synechocystis sp. PCC 7509]|nr:hypothetical protein [Synechocystis sp. PCC 7509]
MTKKCDRTPVYLWNKCDRLFIQINKCDRTPVYLWTKKLSALPRKYLD